MLLEDEWTIRDNQQPRRSRPGTVFYNFNILNIFLIWIAIAIENMRLNDEEVVTEPVREPDDLDEPIIPEAPESGESGVTIASPALNEIPKSRKRIQPSITDYFTKNHQ